MSVNHASMTTHPPQSLPSFAQAFSNQSLSNISSANSALPPIQGHISNMDRDKARLQQRSPPTRPLSRPASEESIARTAGRKRPHNDIVSASREDERSDSEYVFNFDLPPFPTSPIHFTSQLMALYFSVAVHLPPRPQSA
jgi:hypothetical protein